MTDDDLLAELRAARERTNVQKDDCVLCTHIAGMEPGETRDALTAAAAGSIGVEPLCAILDRRGIPGRRRVIERHRKQDHKP